MLFDKYRVELTLLRDQLGTNPLDPHVMDTHILNRQRELILENSKINKEINKYLDAIDISDERKQMEISNLISKLETMYKTTFSDEQKADIIAGKLSNLKETMAEIETSGLTVFFRDQATGRPAIGSHMIYGFLKSAAEAIGRTLPKKNGTVLHSVSYTQSLINQHVKVQEELLVFDRDLKKDKFGETFYLQRSLRAQTAQGPRISLAKSEVVEKGAKLDFTIKVLANSPITEKVLTTLLEYGEFSGLGQWRNSNYGTFNFKLTHTHAPANVQ